MLGHMIGNKWTAARILDLMGRTFVVTGANSGLGLATTRHLASHGAHVVLAVRDEAKGHRAAAGISDAQPVVTIADYSAHEHGVRLSVTAENPAPALLQAAALGAAGSYVPHIAATYRLDQIAQAHARSQAGHALGKLVIKV